jgi:hypothetical protein
MVNNKEDNGHGVWVVEEDDFVEGDWELEDDYFRDLYQQSLKALLGVGYLDSEVTRTGVRTFPVGLLSWWRDVVHSKDKLSLSKLQRISINHGLSIAAHDPRIKEVMKLYTSKMREARDKRDKQLAKILEEKGSALNYVAESQYQTSVGLVKRVEGPLSALSAALGIPITKLIIYLSMLSMMTLASCGWKEMLKEDVEMFWRYVEQRKKALS